MNFDPMDVSLFVLPPKGMSAISMEMPITIRSASITEVYHILMAALPMM